MVKLHAAAIVIVVGLVGGGAYAVWRSRGSSADSDRDHAGTARSEDAPRACHAFLSAMSAACLRCTPKTDGAAECALDGSDESDRCGRAASVRDPGAIDACLKDLGTLSCDDFHADRYPQSCRNVIVFTGTDPPNEKHKVPRAEGTASPKPDSPYRRCVRESIESEIASIRGRGLTPDYKDVEKTAIFTCEATMRCVGERECNAKALGDSKKANEVLERWR
ncbi:MAG: hypothetical protein KF773_38305 [Deltaproteobacteria bacterium]|nr:hypothetical protein [Deltaproteobacteria bacterium]